VEDRRIVIGFVQDYRPAVAMHADRRQPGTGAGLLAAVAVASGFLT
jgi:hypothetical protein